MYPRKLKCPHCGAVYISWGWKEHVQCKKCFGGFEVKIPDPTEGWWHRFIEYIDGLWNPDKRDAKYIKEDKDNEQKP